MKDMCLVDALQLHFKLRHSYRLVYINMFAGVVLGPFIKGVKGMFRNNNLDTNIIRSHEAIIDKDNIIISNLNLHHQLKWNENPHISNKRVMSDNMIWSNPGLNLEITTQQQPQQALSELSKGMQGMLEPHLIWNKMWPDMTELWVTIWYH